jgi:hypothetical protein
MHGRLGYMSGITRGNCIAAAVLCLPGAWAAVLRRASRSFASCTGGDAFWGACAPCCFPVGAGVDVDFVGDLIAGLPRGLMTIGVLGTMGGFVFVSGMIEAGTVVG